MPKPYKSLGDDKFVVVVLFILFFLLVLTRLNAQPYIYTSNDNNSPSRDLWSDENTWTITNDESWLPRTPGYPSTHGNVYGIDIYGYTYRVGNLSTTGANPQYNVYDTLYVDGNLTLGSGAIMNIPSGGLLVVKGDLNLIGNFDFYNYGTIVVTGDLSVSQGAFMETFNDLYVYGSTTSSGGAYFDDGTGRCYPNESCDPEDYTKTESDLQNDDPVLYDFVDTGNANTILPVILHDFSALSKGFRVELTWSTINEENFDYFLIEHSINGTSYKAIGKLTGVGFSQNLINYNFEHNASTLGWNYYRLTAVDVDGSRETFAPISAYVQGNGQSKIFPNPGNGNDLYYSLGDASENYVLKSADLSIRNMEGKLVYHTLIDDLHGKIDINILERGIYFVEIKNNRDTWNFKYMIK